MDIQVLKNFLMVAQEKNITRASEILHISQPTLSRQIQNLEEEFGQKLFYRNNKKVSLTVYGNMLQQRAEEIVSLYEQTQSEIKPDAGVVLGEIRIAVCEASSVDDIYSRGKQFQQEHPFTVLRSACTSSSFGGCSGSGNREMATEEQALANRTSSSTSIPRKRP